MAGHIPAIIPTKVEVKNPTTIAHNGTAAGNLITNCKINAKTNPIRIPITPPTLVNVAASIKN